MNINDALAFFQDLLSDADKKSEKQLYKKFLGVLTGLKRRDLTKEQNQLIEECLDGLDLTAHQENKKKYLTKKHSEFAAYLKTTFSWITEGYYTSQGMIFGMIFGNGIGLAFGSAFGNGSGIAIGLSMGTGIGMAIGMMIGAAKDAEAKKMGRVLKTKLD